MQKLSLEYTLLMFVLLLFLGLGVITMSNDQASASNSNGQPVNTHPMPPKKPPYQPPLDRAKRGTPGIKPSINLTAPKNVARFTEDDVAAFVATKVPLGTTTDQKSQTKVDKIKFLTSHEASVQLKNTSTGLADDDLVCLVTIKGTFYTPSSPNDPAKPPTPTARTPHNTSYMLFDAFTGNLLLMGMGDF